MWGEKMKGHRDGKSVRRGEGRADEGGQIGSV